jgi:acyl-CoA synthetase (AMP-forming)/AMP-acid ligase II
VTGRFGSSAPATVRRTLVDALWEHAHESPDRIALSFTSPSGRQPLTYAEVLARASGLAAILREHPAGTRALILIPSGLDYVTAFFGCALARVIAVPAYPPGRKRQGAAYERVLGVVRDCAPEVVLTTLRIAERLAETGLDEALRGARVLLLDDAEVQDQQTAVDAPLASVADVCFLQYTSGSTGEPRGVEVTFGNLASNCAAIAEAFELSESSSSVIWLPPFHDMGLIGGILSAVDVGYPVHLMSHLEFAADPISWLRLVHQERATVSGGPNFSFELAARRATPEDVAALDLSCWTTAFNGAEPIMPATLGRFSRTFAAAGFAPRAFRPCYGLAENTLLVSAAGGWEPEAVSADSRVACGPAARGCEVAVVDPTSASPVDPGTEGEIWVRGPSVARGYWNRPEESRATFQARTASGAGPYLRTGDLGIWREDELVVTGRRKDLVIVNGVNHYPQDIEITVAGSDDRLHPTGCAVFSHADPLEGEVAVAVQELARRGQDVDPVALVSSIRDRVGREHALRLADVVLIGPGQLPRTTSGKVRRGSARKLWLDGAFERIDPPHLRRQP